MATFLVGEGRRPHELGAVLAALAGVRGQAEGQNRIDVALPDRIADVEELLGSRAGDGTLILESESVPIEDIGFVRRFLERNPHWRILVLGGDSQDLQSRLLALPRTQRLPWPPDLDQLGALLPETSGAAPAEEPEPEPATPPPPEPVVPLPPRVTDEARETVPLQNGEAIDVGGLLEELLAGASVSGDDAPRFLYRCEHPLAIRGERESLAAALTGLLRLARRCAGRGNIVSVQAEGSHGGEPGDGVRVRIDFPLGPLTDGDLPGLLEKPFTGNPDLAEDVASARRGAAYLRKSAGRVQLLVHGHGKLRLEVHLATEPTPVAG